MSRSRDIANLLGAGSVILSGAPSALDTLDELAAALGDDANYASTVTTALNNRVLKTGGDTITVSSGTTVPLTIQNNGTGYSFVVNDEASDATPFVIDASGNMGLGTANPITKFHIAQSTGHSILLDHVSTSGYSSIQFGENGSGKSYIAHFGTSSGGGERLQLWNESASPLTFGTNNTERIRIDSSGNVGIGTTNTASKLTVAGNIETSDGAISSTKQVGSFNWLGDIDGAKWSSKLGGYNLTFGNDGTNATALESWTFGGRTYRGYVQFTNSGDIKISGNFIGAAATNAQTGTSYTLVLSDQSKIIEMNNASANTLTVPTDASVNFPVGTVIDIFQTGAGQTTVGGAGVTINARPGLKLSGQWATATLIKRASNTWLLTGSLSA